MVREAVKQRRTEIATDTPVANSHYLASRGQTQATNQIRNISTRGKKMLHEAVNSGVEIDSKIQTATQAIGNGVKQSVESTGNIFFNFIGKIKDGYNNLNNPNNPSSPTKKLITGIISGSFLLLAVKSTLDFMTGLFNGKKRNNLLKFADASVKWVIGLGVFDIFTGKRKTGGFTNLNTVLLGSGLSLFLSQLSGINDGKHNTMRTLSKLTGSEKTLEEVSGYSPLPSFSDSMSKINPRG